MKYSFLSRISISHTGGHMLPSTTVRVLWEIYGYKKQEWGMENKQNVMCLVCRNYLYFTKRLKEFRTQLFLMLRLELNEEM
jgi:hypothetical protein